MCCSEVEPPILRGGLGVRVLAKSPRLVKAGLNHSRRLKEPCITTLSTMSSLSEPPVLLMIRISNKRLVTDIFMANKPMCFRTVLFFQYLHCSSINQTKPCIATFSTMSWMDSWSRPGKHAAVPPPLYLTQGDQVAYCRTCGRVISQSRPIDAFLDKFRTQLTHHQTLAKLINKTKRTP